MGSVISEISAVSLTSCMTLRYVGKFNISELIALRTIIMEG